MLRIRALLLERLDQARNLRAAAITALAGEDSPAGGYASTDAAAHLRILQVLFGMVISDEDAFTVLI